MSSHITSPYLDSATVARVRRLSQRRTRRDREEARRRAISFFTFDADRVGLERDEPAPLPPWPCSDCGKAAYAIARIEPGRWICPVCFQTERLAGRDPQVTDARNAL